MSLRFFADHCISNFIIDTLQAAGHKVFRLKEHIPPESNDSVVIQKAGELDSILVSLDGDFADIVTYPPSEYKGIFALQIRNHPEIIPELLQRLLNYLAVNTDMDYYKGKLFLIEVHRIRIKS
jgi:predicted nuclease of predicted toxin-antitoxin system